MLEFLSDDEKKMIYQALLFQACELVNAGRATQEVESAGFMASALSAGFMASAQAHLKLSRKFQSKEDRP